MSPQVSDSHTLPLFSLLLKLHLELLEESFPAAVTSPSQPLQSRSLGIGCHLDCRLAGWPSILRVSSLILSAGERDFPALNSQSLVQSSKCNLGKVLKNMQNDKNTRIYRGLVLLQMSFSFARLPKKKHICCHFQISWLILQC